MLLELLIDLYTLPIIDQEIRDLRNAVAQLSRTLQTLQTATAQTAQTAQTAPQTATAPEGLSLSPVRDTNKGNRKLSPMSRSFKKTLHVNYIYLY
jgi:Flp pilus assembly protein TadG